MQKSKNKGDSGEINKKTTCDKVVKISSSLYQRGPEGAKTNQIKKTGNAG